jgi:GMP synthase-like glutamine amidotransferase
MHIHYVQHVPFETPGEIAAWAKERGDEASGTRLFAGEAVPDVGSYDWLVVMGGPMNIYDEESFPWLAGEKRAIEAAIEADKVVVGVCLGAQLIADVLGSKVYRNAHDEIGWFPVTLTAAGAEHPFTREMPSSFTAFHWHGETFDLPHGSVHLAESDACSNQMFVYGDHVVGIQFHLEMTRQGIADLAEHCRDELVEGPFIQTVGEMLSAESRLHAARSILHSLLDRMT